MERLRPVHPRDREEPIRGLPTVPQSRLYRGPLQALWRESRHTPTHPADLPGDDEGAPQDPGNRQHPPNTRRGPARRRGGGPGGRLQGPPEPLRLHRGFIAAAAGNSNNNNNSRQSSADEQAELGKRTGRTQKTIRQSSEDQQSALRK